MPGMRVSTLETIVNSGTRTPMLRAALRGTAARPIENTHSGVT
jgi:hypothetical protein